MLKILLSSASNFCIGLHNINYYLVGCFVVWQCTSLRSLPRHKSSGTLSITLVDWPRHSGHPVGTQCPYMPPCDRFFRRPCQVNNKCLGPDKYQMITGQLSYQYHTSIILISNNYQTTIIHLSYTPIKIYIYDSCLVIVWYLSGPKFCKKSKNQIRHFHPIWESNHSHDGRHAGAS